MTSRVRSGFAVALIVALCGCSVDPRERALLRGDYGYVDDDQLSRRPPRIRAPELRPRSQSAEPVPGTEQVSIYAKVLNQGDGRSPAFHVVAVVTVPGHPPRTFTMLFSDLDAGEDQVVFAGTVNVLSAERPVDVAVQVTADPPVPGSPRGEVFEWDETNNVRTFTTEIRP